MMFEFTREEKNLCLYCLWEIKISLKINLLIWNKRRLNKVPSHKQNCRLSSPSFPKRNFLKRFYLAKLIKRQSKLNNSVSQKGKLRSPHLISYSCEERMNNAKNYHESIINRKSKKSFFTLQSVINISVK